MRRASWLAALVLIAAPAAWAQSLHPPVDPVDLGDLRWMSAVEDPAGLFRRPARALLKPLSAEAALGELLFRSPWIMGGAAKRLGLSCDTCHPQGHRNEHFFFPGVSGPPGTFDPTNPIFNPATDDGVFAPIEIPSLRGAALGGPFGKTAREPSLRRFVRHVIVDEFRGIEPEASVLDALVAYIERIGPTNAPEAPIDLEADVEAIGRWVALIGPLLEHKATALLRLAVASVRSELGRLHERFPGEDASIEREILEGMAAALGLIDAAVEDGRTEEARRRLKAWTIAFEDFDRPWLVSAAPKSLYDSTTRAKNFGLVNRPGSINTRTP